MENQLEQVDANITPAMRVRNGKLHRAFNHVLMFSAGVGSIPTKGTKALDQVLP